MATETISRRTKLDRKFDKIKKLEEQGLLQKREGSRAIRKLLRNPLSIFGITVFLLIVLMSIFAPLLTSFDPQKIDLRSVLQPPSGEHLLGTDKLGRDIWSRLLYGGQLSILIGFGSAVGAAVIGVFIGVIAAYRGGFLDALVMRISEIFMSFPQIILVLLLVTLMGQSMTNLMIIFMITGWCGVYRMTRSKILSIREEEYVQALKAFGISDWVICYKYMLPNAISVIAVNITLNTAMFILQEASLSFLGLGVPFQVPTWGNIINVANDFTILQNAWWIWAPVGAVISLFVLSVNFIGDGLRDSTDPTQQG